jgi:hypothetical protein
LPPGGYVDHIRIDAQVFIHGWGLLQSQVGRSCVCIDTNLPIVAADIAVSPRGDVVAAIGDARLANCGFQIRLTLDHGAAWPQSPRVQPWTEDAVYGRHRLRIEHLPAVTAAGSGIRRPQA